MFSEWNVIKYQVIDQNSIYETNKKKIEECDCDESKMKEQISPRVNCNAILNGHNLKFFVSQHDLCKGRQRTDTGCKPL